MAIMKKKQEITSIGENMKKLESSYTAVGNAKWCSQLPWRVWQFLRMNWKHAAAAAKSLQSCLTLCNPIDSSPPGSAVPGILQARTLECVAISFSNAWKLKVKVKLLSRVRLLAIPWTAAYQAPPSIGFSRQEYWSGLPFLLHNWKHMST